MGGSIVTILVVVGLVAIYMRIVHQFLRAAEEPEDAAREEQFRQLQPSIMPPRGKASGRAWAEEANHASAAE